MTQTAALSTRQSLHISTHSVTRDAIVKNESLNTAFSEPTFFTQPQAFFYNEQVRLVFSVNEKYASHFILIKGLIEFHRSKDLRFVFRSNDKSFEIDIALQQVEYLNDFLTKIYHWLNQEIKFKSVLKKVIEFERRYKINSDQIYGYQEAILR